MSFQYERILVAVDGSKEAEWAFKKSVGIARRNEAVLYLVSVLDTRLFHLNNIPDHSVLKGAESKAQLATEKLLNRYKSEAEAAGVQKVELIIERGSPRIIIPRAIAKRVDADLIICGASGLNRMERYILGSVSQQITRISPCDVLVVRTEEEVEELPKGERVEEML